MSKLKQPATWWFIAALLCFAVLVNFQASAIYGSSLQYDDAYNASIAKNIANGTGYASSYEKLRPFNPEISTGFPMMLIGAFFILIFGNQYWVPSLSSAFLTDALLLGAFLVLRRRIGTQKASMVAVISLIGFSVFTSDHLNGEGAAYLRAWYQFIGEIPCAILCFIGALTVFDPSGKTNRKQLLLSTAIFTLAFHVKTIALFSFPSLAYGFWIYRKNETKKIATKTLLLMITVIAIPGTVLNVVQFAAVRDVNEWATIKNREKNFRNRAGSGVHDFKRHGIYWMIERTPKNTDELARQFGGALPPALLLLTAVALAVVAYKKRKSDALNQLAFVVSLAFIVHIFWWVTISPNGWVRHAFIGLALLVLSVGIGLVAVGKRRLWMSAFPILAICFNYPVFSKLAPAYVQTSRLKAQLRTASYLETIKLEQLYGFGWWANRDFEYLMTNSMNFKDASKMRESKPFLLVRSDFWGGDIKDQLDALTAQCDAQTVYQDGPFIVSKCPAQE
ncbi:MAG: hypothetical protein EOP06_07440, partial [Proteobacteria bacterium]